MIKFLLLVAAAIVAVAVLLIAVLMIFLAMCEVPDDTERDYIKD